MGATASREFNDAVATCINGGDSFENLLEDPDFARRCQAFYEALPSDAQKRLEELTPQQHLARRGKDRTQQQPQATREEGYLSKLHKVKEADICIPKGLEPIYTSWIQPTVFFNPSERLKGASTASQLYEQLRQIGQRKVDDPIRTRIYAVALYDLRLQIDHNDHLQLKRGIKNKIIQVISESSIVNDSLQDVEKWTTLYLKFGERMRWIAAKNGGLGALIMIPPSLFSFHQWARGLSTANLKDVIQRLQSLQIAEKADKAKAHDVANRIHSLALQGLTSGIAEPNANREELIPDKEPNDHSTTGDVVENDSESDGSPDASNASSSFLYAAKRTNETSILEQNTSKRGRTCPNNSTVTPSPMPLDSDATRNTLEKNRYHPPEQSSASRIPSLQHLIHETPLHSFDHNINSGGCDSTNTNSRIETAVNGTAHQSFSHFDTVPFSHSNTTQGAHGSILSQCLQYDGQSPRSEDVLTTRSVNYFPTYSETGGAECTTGSIDYFPTYPEVGVVEGMASGSHLDTECTTGSVSYFLPYSEVNGVFTSEAPEMTSDSGAAAGTVAYFPTYIEADGVFTDETSILHYDQNGC
ncbi:MAG: hypothetical protein Q9167_005769 [Letrouitia subvulpina]